MGTTRPPSRLLLVGWTAALAVACGLGTGGAAGGSSGAHDGGALSADGTSSEPPSDDGATPDSFASQDDGPGTQGGSSGGGSSSGSASSGSSSGGSPDDAYADQATPSDAAGTAGDGGPTPGFVECAGTMCSLSSSVCCTCPGCFPLRFPRRASPRDRLRRHGRPLGCDDRSDRTATGQVCCASFASSVFTQSACKKSCANSDAQLCDVDAECAHGTCAPSSSFPGFSVCM